MAKNKRIKTYEPKGERVEVKDSRHQYVQYSGEMPKVEEKRNPATVINRFPHPMTLSYEGNAMILPPRSRNKIADSEKLGHIPKGIMLVRDKK